MSFQDTDSDAVLVESTLRESSSLNEEDGDSYTEDDFEAYSDSFESDDDDRASEAPAASAPPTSSISSSSSSSSQWRTGDRVQVYWEDERRWFDGTVIDVDSSRRPGRHLVQYDDGEVQWEEDPSIMRPALEATIATEQLEVVVTGRNVGEAQSVIAMNQRVFVYWPTEMEWFSGVIADVNVDKGIFVQYSDGDEQWISPRSYRDVMIVPASGRVNPLQEQDSMPTAASRMLTPRPYQPVCEDHFKHERIARAYRMAVSRHASSILVPRTYSSRRDHRDYVSMESTLEQSTLSQRHDSSAQTEIKIASTA